MVAPFKSITPIIVPSKRNRNDYMPLFTSTLQPLSPTTTPLILVILCLGTRWKSLFIRVDSCCFREAALSSIWCKADGFHAALKVGRCKDRCDGRMNIGHCPGPQHTLRVFVFISMNWKEKKSLNL